MCYYSCFIKLTICHFCLKGSLYQNKTKDACRVLCGEGRAGKEAQLLQLLVAGQHWRRELGEIPEILEE